MKKYILFSCDNWHSWASMELLAVCSSLNNAIKLAKKKAKIDGCKISADGLYMLKNKLQTQDYENGEFYIQEITQNELN